jgi:hypothetical protein
VQSVDDVLRAASSALIRMEWHRQQVDAANRAIAQWMAKRAAAEVAGDEAKLDYERYLEELRRANVSNTTVI